MRPAGSVTRQPALLVSAGYLALVAEGALRPSTDPAALYLAGTGGGVGGTATVVRLGGEAQLPTLRAVAVFAGDGAAHASLRAAGVPWVTLPDAGRPAALRRLAERLDLVEWWTEETTPVVLARALGALAGHVDAVGSGAPGPCLGALEVAVALEGGGHAAGAAALVEAARACGLWPQPALGAGGVPHALAAAEAASLRARPGAVALFAQAAAALVAARPDGLLPAPAMRPLLLGPVPSSGDEGEARQLERYCGLSRPLPLLPAPDPAALECHLVGEFPWMSDAIRAVVREVALRGLGDGACRLPPLLVLGPPGVGKTRLCRLLAEACRLPWRRLAVSDGSAVTALAGNGRGWRGGRPCLAADLVASSAVLNPLVVVDDLDRAGSDDRYGTPAEFLLTQLDVEGSRGFLDPFLLAPLDLSHVSWVVTANDASGLPGALLDRLLTLEVGPPPGWALDRLVEGVLDDVAQEAGLTDASALPPLPRGLLAELRAALGAGQATVRLVTRSLRQALGAALMGHDARAAAKAVLAAARGRDDRPYAGGRGEVGFRRVESTDGGQA